MATITEDYVSFEIANLLKEKGFDEPCRAYWDDQPVNSRVLFWTVEPHKHYGKEINAPTYQMAMKWLREEKNIIVNVWYNGVDWDAEYYNNKDENFYLITDSSCNSYEQAVEAALKYSLENLI